MTFDLEGQGQGQIGKNRFFDKDDEFRSQNATPPTVLDAEP